MLPAKKCQPPGCIRAAGSVSFCEKQQTGDDQIKVVFDHDVAAVTPGQSAVLYNGEECLGGGIIEQRLQNI